VVKGNYRAIDLEAEKQGTGEQLCGFDLPRIRALPKSTSRKFFSNPTFAPARVVAKGTHHFATVPQGGTTEKGRQRQSPS
jgi:hypothetical protein